MGKAFSSVLSRKRPSDSDNANDNAKRAKLTPLYDTTLQDLPGMVIKRILLEAAAMEVVDMGFARNAWKEKAELVINSFGTVCTKWNSIVTTSSFRDELHRTLDDTAEKEIRLEILQQSPFQLYAHKIAALRDEIFILCKPKPGGDYAINVYDRKNLAKVKAVIPLPDIWPERMAASSVSNCVYVVYRKNWDSVTVLRITKDNRNRFNTTTLMNDVLMPCYKATFSVAANGSLIFSRQEDYKLPVICIFNADGSLQRQMKMNSNIPMFSDIIPKSNGNLVLVSSSEEMPTTLTEIDMDVTIIRQYQSSSKVRMFGRASQADEYGRILLSDRLNKIELLDSDFNLLKFSGPKLKATRFIYDSERNEVITIVSDWDFRYGALATFRFMED